MSAREVIVVSTGTANLASVLAGVRRAGGVPRVAQSSAEIDRASAVIVPGVGSYAAALESLRSNGLADAIRDRVLAERPTLLVCLGLQILGRASAESPGVEGLTVFDARVERFPNEVTVPQLGWNRVEPDDECVWIRSGHAYFANSFRMVTPPDGWSVAKSVHGGPFVAAIERGPVLACQFHPELSGTWGLDLMRRWLDTVLNGVPATEGERSC